MHSVTQRSFSTVRSRCAFQLTHRDNNRKGCSDLSDGTSTLDCMQTHRDIDAELTLPVALRRSIGEQDGRPAYSTSSSNESGIAADG